MPRGSVVNNPPANAGKEISIPWWERSPGEGPGELGRQKSTGWQKSQTQLSTHTLGVNLMYHVYKLCV